MTIIDSSVFENLSVSNHPSRQYGKDRDADYTVILYDPTSKSQHGMWESRGSQDTANNYQFPFVCEASCSPEVDEGCISMTTEPESEAPRVGGQGHEFVLLRNKTSYLNAMRKCKEEGGRLACPRNRAQQDEIASFIRWGTSRSVLQNRTNTQIP